MNQLKLLWELQETDKKAHKIKGDYKRLASLKTWEDARRSLEKKEKNLKEKKDSLEEERKKLRRLEMKSQDIMEEIKEIKGIMYGEKVHSTKELMQMEKKVQSLSQENTRLEDQILQQMERLEGLEEEIKGDLKDLEEEKEKVRGLEKVCKGEREELKKEYSKLKGKGEELREKIPQELLDKYETVRENATFDLVAPVKGGRCMECQVSLSSSVVGKLYTPGIRLTCENCGRLIFLEDRCRG